MDWGTELWVSPFPPASHDSPLLGSWPLRSLSPKYLSQDSALSLAADPMGPRPLPSALSQKFFGDFQDAQRSQGILYPGPV